MYTKNELVYDRSKIKEHMNRRNEKARNDFKLKFEKLFGKTFSDRSHIIQNDSVK